MQKKFFDQFFEIEFTSQIPKKRFNEIVLKVREHHGNVYGTDKKDSYKIVCKISKFSKIRKEIKKILEEKDSA